ncbi:MAG: hypothetical protein FJW38_12855 [Acidobacteria bacterium]|nr:hypothetical protein [Acidobacteriota bacterium]
MVEISGVVVDAQSKPIPDVHVMHAGGDFKTPADGTFRLSTSSPFVVFRHYRFASIVRRPGELKDVRIQMSTISLNRFSACVGHQFDKPTLATFAFRISYAPGVVELESLLQGGDTSYRVYALESSHAARMLHETGINLSLGFPEDTEKWSSVEYREVSFAAGRVPIVDSRGVTADGKRWRFLGRLTETISYGPLPPHEAAIFDRAIDGVCGLN